MNADFLHVVRLSETGQGGKLVAQALGDRAHRGRQIAYDILKPKDVDAEGQHRGAVSVDPAFDPRYGILDTFKLYALFERRRPRVASARKPMDLGACGGP